MLSVIIAVLILINSNLIPLHCRLTTTGIIQEDVYCLRLHMIGTGIPWLCQVTRYVQLQQQVGRCPQVQRRLQPYNLVLAHNEIQLLLDMIHQLIPSSRSRPQSVQSVMLFRGQSVVEVVASLQCCQLSISRGFTFLYINR